MIFIKKITNIILLATIIALSSSCNKWLDIDPNDRVCDYKLYSNIEGFRTALNGIYVEMNTSTLYSSMPMKVLDVMAQYYDCTNNEKYNSLSKFEYQQSENLNTFSDIWEKYYFLIANCNTIIKNCEDNTNKLDTKQIKSIMAESIALRAFFHFELLRIYGPIYSVSPNKLSIPYMNTYDNSLCDILSAKEVSLRIDEDLKTAEDLLSDNDSILNIGPSLFADNNMDINDRYRSIRMNCIAIKALRARLALYTNNTGKAHKLASSVIGDFDSLQDKGFLLTSNNDNLDRVYQSELLFSVYNIDRNNIYDKFYSNNNIYSLLRISEFGLDKIYSDTDIRYLFQWQELSNADQKTNLYFVKYKTSKNSNQKEYNNLIPIIRISEMYYIIAETAENVDEAIDALNKVRASRKTTDLQKDCVLPVEIMKEYTREFVGEGQLFFFYKRLNFTEIPVFSSKDLSVVMDESKYVIPVPNSEIFNR